MVGGNDALLCHASASNRFGRAVDIVGNDNFR